MGSATEMADITPRGKLHDFAFGPGFGREFLPLGLAVSYFFVWGLSGVAVGGRGAHDGFEGYAHDAALDRALGRVQLFHLRAADHLVHRQPDHPELENHRRDHSAAGHIVQAREWTGGSLISGLIMAAPFGAVMATVSSYLVMIASGLVRDAALHPPASDGCGNAPPLARRDDRPWAHRRGGQHQPGQLPASLDRVQLHHHRGHVPGAPR